MIEQKPNVTDQINNPEGDQNPQQDKNDRIIRLIKSIIVNPERATYVDDRIVKYKYYNSFNYSLLSREYQNVNLAIGITSPKQNEGKTLIACNLAVSFAMGSKKNTLLVDLNIVNPRLHEIFGLPQAPGLTEALNDGEIHVSQTAVDNLSVLTIGKMFLHHETLFLQSSPAETTQNAVVKPSLGLEQLAAFRDIIYSLEQQYDLIIVDMPPMNIENVPVLFANQLQGLIVVVHSGKTKREDLDQMFQRINERQVLGFVFNHFSDHPAK